MTKVLDWSPKFLFGRPRPVSNIRNIIIHVTVNTPGTPAENVANYQLRTQSGSYHELVDTRPVVLIENTDDWFTWSSGNKGNDVGWHLSLVMMGTETRDQWLKQEAMLRAAAERCAIRAKKYGIPVVKLTAADLRANKRGFCGHLETGQAWGGTDHVDPGKHFPWDVFLRYVKEAMSGGAKHAKVETTPPPAPAKRVWPMAKDSYEVASGFSQRKNPVTGRTEHHNGVDLAAPLGTPIYSTSDGLVIEGKDRAEGTVDGFHNWVWIDSQRECGRDFIYGHMRHADIYVRKGDRVKAGQLIARVGAEGQATGPHVHFEEWTPPGRIGGRAVDPLPALKNATHPDGSTKTAPGESTPPQKPAPVLKEKTVDDKYDKILTIVTLIADQLLGWPKDDNGDYLIAGWDVDTIIASAETKLADGKGITLVEQIALLQKSDKHQNEALQQTNRAISEMLHALKEAK